MKQILLLHGARQNSGDFLIRHRGLSLMKSLTPLPVIDLPRWRPIPAKLLRDISAVVLCGGPSLREDFYPETYRLTSPISDLGVPILPLAIGWSGEPKNAPGDFRLSPASADALAHIDSTVGLMGARDEITLALLHRLGFSSAVLTGCTAWYDEDFLGAKFIPPGSVRRLVVSAPAKLSNFRAAARVLAYLSRRYRGSDRLVTFNRGIGVRGDTGVPRAVAQYGLALAASSSGFRVLDSASSADQLLGMSEFDLHVGFRVHSHLAALSQRRPSVLISEDGRGLGQAVTLGDPYSIRADEPALVDRLEAVLSTEEAASYPSSRAAVEVIEATYPTMRRVAKRLA